MTTNMLQDATMPIPVAGLAGDDLDLGDGDVRAVEQLHLGVTQKGGARR
jgi:hypothetical protein